ncbi:hypothetical protein [Niveispirillum sp. KHB5.9]|uniref:hypothetical protein n=1 Tax=Niveispirillum sp. KHB5.9 TaxID=3400269 RepID=UPI003A8AE4DA
MIRFYGFDFNGLMRLPIRTFWSMNAMIERVRSEEVLAILPAHAVTMGGDGVGKIVDSLRQKIGTTSVVEQVAATEQDYARMQRMFGGEV